MIALDDDDDDMDENYLVYDMKRGSYYWSVMAEVKEGGKNMSVLA